MSPKRKRYRQNVSKHWQPKNVVNVLGVEAKIYKDIECAKNLPEEILIIPYGIWNLWQCISLNMGDLEWGGVFYVIDDKVMNFRVPKQEVTGGSCHYLEDDLFCLKCNKSIEMSEAEESSDGKFRHICGSLLLRPNGMVHLHPHKGMTSHSSVDDISERNMFDYSIVLSKDNYEACKRVKLACGAFSYIPVKIVFSDFPQIDLSKITEKKTYFAQDGYHQDSHDGYTERENHYG